MHLVYPAWPCGGLHRRRRNGNGRLGRHTPPGNYWGGRVCFSDGRSSEHPQRPDVPRVLMSPASRYSRTYRPPRTRSSSRPSLQGANWCEVARGSIGGRLADTGIRGARAREFTASGGRALHGPGMGAPKNNAATPACAGGLIFKVGERSAPPLPPLCLSALSLKDRCGYHDASPSTTITSSGFRKREIFLRRRLMTARRPTQDQHRRDVKFRRVAVQAPFNRGRTHTRSVGQDSRLTARGSMWEQAAPQARRRQRTAGCRTGGPLRARGRSVWTSHSTPPRRDKVGPE